MAQNKNALIRYKTIDKCLQNQYRQWTLEDLIEACSDALEEFEGRKNPISKRTIQLDIQMMRSEKLGYNAPIEVYDKKYYHYEDPDYTINNLPITSTDIDVLSETILILKQFKNFSLFNDVSDIMQRLEDKVYAEKSNSKPVIYLDKNDNLKGLNFLEDIYNAIVKKIVVEITYKSFKSKNETVFMFYPFILKQFNNRWFVIGKKQINQPIMNLALDRIVKIDYDFNLPFINDNFDADLYFKDVVGVTVNQGLSTENIELWFNSENAPYITTKPLHHSQKVISQNEDGSILISLDLKLNNELERLILGFGKGVEVIKPRKLRNKIAISIQKALEYYTEN